MLFVCKNDINALIFKFTNHTAKLRSIWICLCGSNINKNIHYEPCSMCRRKSCQSWCLYCKTIHLLFMLCTDSDVDFNGIIFCYSARLYYCYIFRNPIYLIHARSSFMINFSTIIYVFVVMIISYFTIMIFYFLDNTSVVSINKKTDLKLQPSIF